MGLIIAVLLAVTAGILVISTPHAATTGDELALAPAFEEHAREGYMHPDSAHGHNVQSPGHDHASAEEDCGDPASGTHGKGGMDCCGTGACHAVQALAAPMLHAPCASAVVLALFGDEQVESLVPEGLDRPPRTI
ncbi:hypothetical protein DC522_05170 [Microvirga sp. KLBC 81]|nr:hypothetical protein DC522_05170 [Microvirga sp. KLBC 81]